MEAASHIAAGNQAGGCPQQAGQDQDWLESLQEAKGGKGNYKLCHTEASVHPWQEHSSLGERVPPFLPCSMPTHLLSPSASILPDPCTNFTFPPCPLVPIAPQSYLPAPRLLEPSPCQAGPWPHFFSLTSQAFILFHLFSWNLFHFISLFIFNPRGIFTLFVAQCPGNTKAVMLMCFMQALG